MRTGRWKIAFQWPVWLGAAGFGVEIGAAFGAGFEAFVQPEVLFGLFAHALFDEVVHALYVGLHVFAGEVFPGGVEAQDNVAVGLAGGDGGHDFGLGKGGDAGEAGDGGGGDAEEVGEDGIFAAEVLVGQVEEGGGVGAQVFDDGAQAFGAADEEDVVVAVAAAQNLLVEHGVFLVGIHAGERHVLVERVHGELEGGEVGIEQDDFIPGGELVVEMMFVLVADEGFEPLGAAIPIEAVFEDEFSHVAEVAFEQGFALFLAQFGEAQAQVDFADAAAGGDGVIGEAADGVGQLLDGGEGQQLDEVKKEKGDFHGRVQSGRCRDDTAASRRKGLPEMICRHVGQAESCAVCFQVAFIGHHESKL